MKSKKILILLTILLISIIAFIGIYVLNLNKLMNIVPDYNYSTDISGAREYILVVDNTEEEKTVYLDENNNIVGEAKKDDQGNTINVEGYRLQTVKVKKNEESNLKKENYEKSKKIIEKRIKDLEINDYKIRLDRQSGNMIIEMKQDENTDNNYALLSTKGKFEVKDNQTGIILLNNSQVESANVTTNTTVSGGYKVFLQVIFDEEGTKKLNEISKNYVSTTTENEENKIKYVTIELDGATLNTTYFSEEWNSNSLYIPVSDEINDATILKETIDSVQRIANIIDYGELPIQYTLQSDNFVKSAITEKHINTFEYSIIGFLIIVIIVLTVIYKGNGFEIGIANMGFVAIFSLILRYFKVEISISGIIAILSMIILNLAFSIIVLKNRNAFNEKFKNYNLSILPVIIFSLIFTLVKNINIQSIGTVLFWGIIIFEIYNITVTKMLIKNNERN